MVQRGRGFGSGSLRHDLVETIDDFGPLYPPDSSLPSITPADLGLSGSKTFAEIMGSVDELLVAFELVDNVGFQNQEHGGIDNAQLVPEPSSLALLLMGGTMFLCFRLVARRP